MWHLDHDRTNVRTMLNRPLFIPDNTVESAHNTLFLFLFYFVLFFTVLTRRPILKDPHNFNFFMNILASKP